MDPVFRAVVAVLIGLTAWCSASPAAAVSCDHPYDAPFAETVVLPADGAAEVPTNALVWVGSEGALTSFLDGPGQFEVTGRDEAGEAVVLSETLHFADEGLSSWRAFELPAEVDPRGRWTIEVVTGVWDPAWGDDERPRTTTTFTWGAGADLESPETPELRSVRLDSGAGGLEGVCGDEASVLPDRVMLDLGGAGALRLVSKTVDGSPGESVTVSTSSTVDVAGSFQPGGPIGFAVASVDLAGNRSAWSQPYATTMPLAGCSRTESPEAGLLLPGLAGGLRRRRLP